jgi:hypothetical protein
VDACDGVDSGVGTSVVVLGRGARVGGWSDLTVLEEPLEPLRSERGREPVGDDVLTVFPGNALAATSENTAVSATEPVTSQRLARLSLRSAASLAAADLGDMVNGGGGRPRSGSKLRSGG